LNLKLKGKIIMTSMYKYAASCVPSFFGKKAEGAAKAAVQHTHTPPAPVAAPVKATSSFGKKATKWGSIAGAVFVGLTVLRNSAGHFMTKGTSRSLAGMRRLNGSTPTSTFHSIIDSLIGGIRETAHYPGQVFGKIKKLIKGEAEPRFERRSRDNSRYYDDFSSSPLDPPLKPREASDLIDEDVDAWDKNA
jgi:hypothetical protein